MKRSAGSRIDQVKVFLSFLFLVGVTFPLVVHRQVALGRFIWFWCLVVLVTPIHVAVHELGHVVGGALVGFRFSSVRIFWITIRRADGALQLGWSHPEIPGLSGYHRVLPGSPRTGFRAAVHVFAGPAATVATALICFAATVFVTAPSSQIAVA